jgi:pantothenate kinase-related protein Tda10
MLKKFFLYIFIFFFCIPAFTQNLPPNYMLSEDQQRKTMERLEEENPQLAKYQARLNEINKIIQATIADYREGKISRERAEQTLRSLIKEQLETTRDPDYIVAMQLYMLLSKQP